MSATVPPRRHVWLARVFYLAATFSVIHLLFGGARWIDAIATVLDTIALPVSNIGFGFAAFYFVVGLSLSRRKRLAWWIAVILVGLILLTDITLLISFATMGDLTTRNCAPSSYKPSSTRSAWGSSSPTCCSRAAT